MDIKDLQQLPGVGPGTAGITLCKDCHYKKHRKKKEDKNE